MANTSSRNGLTFAICYGLGGGPMHARNFLSLMKGAKITPAQKVGEADIIIAHSGGCWLIPKTAKPKLVVYVGMPLEQDNPRQAWRASNAAMFKSDGVVYGLINRLKNLYYCLRQPIRNLKLIGMSKTAQPVILPKAQAIFITNRDDAWPRPNKIKKYINKYDWAYISLTGAHDDIWHHPAQYIDIIERYARLLA